MSGYRTWLKRTSVTVPMLLVASLLPLQSVAAEETAEPAPGVTGAISSAVWHWAESYPDGRRLASHAPLTFQRLGRDGESVWAAQWQLSKPQPGVSVSMRFEGLPVGVEVAPAGMPRVIDKAARAKVQACKTLIAGTVECLVKAPSGVGTQRVVSPVRLIGSAKLPDGRHEVTVTLFSNGQPVAGRGPEVARYRFAIDAREKTPTEFYVDRQGQPLVTAYQPSVQQISVYRLSGPSKPGVGRFALSNVVHKSLRGGVKVKGDQWTCSGGGCSRKDRFEVGRSAPPLGLLWGVNNTQVKAWPKIDGAKARNAVWWTKHQYDGRSDSRIRQQLSLITYKKPPVPEFKNSKEVLATTKRAQVTTMVQRLGPARLRGDGLFSVHVGNGGSRDAKSVRVRIKAPGHTKVTRIKHAKKWRCEGTECRWGGVLKKKRTLPPIKVLVRSGSKAKKSARNQDFVAVASWTANKQKGRKSDRGASKAAWLKPLRVEALTTNAVVHSKSGIKTQLQGLVSNTDGSQVHFRWKQTAGPAVNWVSPRTGSVGDGTVGARFTPPKVQSKKKLTFQVKVTGAGATATDTVKVTALPAGVKGAQWDPRVATTVPLSPEEATEKLNNPRDPDTYKPLTTKAASSGRINDSGVTLAKPGQRITLKVTKRTFRKGVEEKKTTWRIDGAKPPKSMKPDLRKQGRVLLITVPAKRTKPIVATAQRHLNKDRRADTGEVVLIKPPKPKQSVPSGASLSSFSGITFCDFFGDLSISETFTIGTLTFNASEVTPSGTSCTASDASLSVTADPVVVNGVTLDGLTLTMTSSSVELSATSITLPDGSDGAVDAIDLTGSLTASWTSTGLTSFAGTFTASNLSTLPYLQLPDGWAISTGTFSYSESSGSASVSLSITATGPNSGQATLSGSIASGGVFSLDASMQNALTLTGYDGSVAVFGGSGSVARSSTGAFTYDIELDMTTTSFEIINDVSLGSASLTWDNSGLTLDGSVTTTIGGDSVVFTASATVTSFSNWTATITSTATPSVSSLPLASLSGTFGYASSAFTFDVTASVTVTDVSSFLDLTLTTASASIMNSCPAGDSSCTSGQLRLELQVAGSVELFSDTIAVNTTVVVDLTTGDFDADFSLAGADFGPAEAQLNSVSFFVANDGASDPNLAGNPCAPSGTGTVYGFTATATILSDVSFDVTGVYQGGTSSNPSGSGYCFYGQVDSTDISQLSGAGLSDSLNFLYSTYATTADSQNIPATSPTMWATMALPSEVQSYIGNAVTGFTVLIELVTTGSSVTGLTIDGLVDMQAYVAGSATDLPSFELTTIGVSLQVSTGTTDSVEVSFDCDGVLTTPGSADGSMTQSTMTFDASIGITTANGGALNLTANLESSSAVNNAFGVQGLTIQDLGIAANVGFDALINSSLTISTTNLELPSTVATPIGLNSKAPIDFSLTVGIKAPCFYISIGTPDQTTSAAIDWGGAGVLEAYYFKLLLAPAGNCTESDGTQITGNFAVDFNGYIFGDSVDISGEVEITPQFSASLNIDVGGFNLAGVQMETTIIDLVFDPAGGKFDLNFSGGVNLWGAVIVQVSGEVDIDLTAESDNIDIAFDGYLSVNLFGLFTGSVDVQLEVDAGVTDGSFYLNTLDVSLAGELRVLIFEANASFTLDYSDGKITTLSGSFGVSMNLWIIDLGVELAFSYDPAETGNQDLAITVTGWMDIDLWLFTIDLSVSFTIDVDASFLASSEYQPQPAQKVPAPMSLVSGNPNTNPHTWSYTADMFQANNLGWMANLEGYQQAVADAAGASTETLWNSGYFTSEWGALEPESLNWIGSNSWPGAYTSGWSSTLASTFSVVPTNSSATVGNSTSPVGTTSELEVTVSLPASPLMADMYAMSYDGSGWTQTSSVDWSSTCNPGTTTTVTYDVQIPSVPGAASGNWSWVMQDVNWRLYGSTLRETSDLMLNAWTSLPDWDTYWDYYNGNSAFVSPQAMVPVPYETSQVQSGSTYAADCGYSDFADQTSLYDFMGEQGIPWETLPAPALDSNLAPYSETSEGTGPLQPGWGGDSGYSGWQPYSLNDTKYSDAQAYNVSVADSSFPCTPGAPVNITNVWNPGNLWGDPNNGWVAIPPGGYVQAEDNRGTWELHLFNSDDQELQWNGSSWVTAPAGGFTSSYSPLAQGGQFMAADHNGAVYASGAGHLTYIAFTSDNAISQQAEEDVSNASYQYVPVQALNVCTYAGELSLSDPEDATTVQGEAPSAIPTFPSLTTLTFGPDQAYLVDGWGADSLQMPQCTAVSASGVPEGLSVSLAQGSIPPSNLINGWVDLAENNWYLQLEQSDGTWSLNLYNTAGQELRWSEASSTWITEPSTGWSNSFPYDLSFASNISVMAASTTGVLLNGLGSDGWNAIWLWYSPLNPAASSGSFPYTLNDTPDPGLNDCTSGDPFYSGS